MICVAACVFSISLEAAKQDETLTAKQRRELADQYAQEAMELLGKAQQRGCFDKAGQIRHLKEDSDLDPIRMREDFQDLVRRLEQQPR